MAFLALVSLLLTSSQLPPRAQVVANGELAASYFLETTKDFNCEWTRGTFMLGLIEFYKMSQNASLLTYSQDWANYFDYQVCGNKKKDVTNANNQLCGATYTELYKIAGSTNKTMLAAILKEFDSEIADPTSVKLWSWVDALFMAMNTWARIGNVTGDQKYFDHMAATFNTSATETLADGGFQFWSNTYHLFYRDDRFLNSTIFWSRGNGWAIGALVAALEYTPEGPAKDTFKAIFTQHAEALLKSQGSDGMWRSSILNATGYPTPETTGSALMTYGIAYGLNNGLLSSETYMPVVEKAWKFLSTEALHSNGLVGYCQPAGGSPENNFNSNSTSDFCVGQFLLAVTEVSKLTN